MQDEGRSEPEYYSIRVVVRNHGGTETFQNGVAAFHLRRQFPIARPRGSELENAILARYGLRLRSAVPLVRGDEPYPDTRERLFILAHRHAPNAVDRNVTEPDFIAIEFFSRAENDASRFAAQDASRVVGGRPDGALVFRRRLGRLQGIRRARHQGERAGFADFKLTVTIRGGDFSAAAADARQFDARLRDRPAIPIHHPAAQNTQWHQLHRNPGGFAVSHMKRFAQRGVDPLAKTGLAELNRVVGFGDAGYAERACGVRGGVVDVLIPRRQPSHGDRHIADCGLSRTADDAAFDTAARLAEDRWAGQKKNGQQAPGRAWQSSWQIRIMLPETSVNARAIYRICASSARSSRPV